MGTQLTIDKFKTFQLKFDLFEHQKETVRFMLKNPWAYILNQPGTGKTECAISVAMYQKIACRAQKILIVSTLSTLKNVWFDSIFHHQFEQVLEPVVVHGPKSKKQKILQEDKFSTYIINPNGIENLKDLLMGIKWDMIIVDEATCFNNHTSAQSKAMLKIVKNHRPKFFYLMTGTPTPNYPSDCFGILRLFNPTEYSSFTRFRPTVEKEVRQWTWQPLPDAYDTVSKLLQPAICFKKQEVLKIENTIFEFLKVGMTDKQTQAFKDMKKDFVAIMEDGKSIVSPQAGVKLNKMLQILGGSILDEDGTIYQLGCDPKLTATYNIVKNKAKNKTIIFCSHKAQLDVVSNYLKEKGLDTAIISGDISQKNREVIFYKFQKTKEIDVIIAIPDCMAHGITLTAADTIIYFNAIHDNEIYEQANARIARPGQEFTPYIYHLYCNNVDYARFMRLQKRMSDQDYLLTLLTEE